MVRGRAASSSKSNRAERAKKEEEDDDDEVEAAEASALSDEAKRRAAREKVGSAQLPNELKKLRACMICSLIKSGEDFENEGCDNCDRFLNYGGMSGSQFGYTSITFEGMIAMINPEESWVAKWQRIVPLKPGMYAVSVSGKIAKWVKRDMADSGVSCVSRDKRKDNNAESNDDDDDDDDELESRCPRRRKKKKSIKIKIKTAPVVDLDSDESNLLEI